MVCPVQFLVKEDAKVFKDTHSLDSSSTQKIEASLLKLLSRRKFVFCTEICRSCLSDHVLKVSRARNLLWFSKVPVAQSVRAHALSGLWMAGSEPGVARPAVGMTMHVARLR
ncbi:hypothetical protein AVEN_87891-1 [Araneus ventricosus]|uniref:Uncharacterized protein n=1 Tax=Araneus ventricosus TaxID=182803 RepID=A0A4Y2BB69_ARAVE|nr:hypothetical protein AVEN_87891-1 [Araneus ventricosus]